MHYYGHRKRLKKRLQELPAQLFDYELLELLLGYVLVRRDTKPLAKSLLKEFGSLRDVLAAPNERLLNIEGVGPSLIVFFTLLREINARQSEAVLLEKEALCDAKTVAQMARKRLGFLSHEELWVDYFNTQNYLISWEKASKGSLDRVMIYPRDILERALILRASGFILVHNHPGGLASPSGADIALTQQVQKASQTLFIRFIDHVIVTKDAEYSLVNEGLL